ncbi:ABC transporter permease subunit [Kitasatospora sp. NPDC049285]|uniref:ABC transporter permease n=1 Tax=Kitasatospora sp. NPDC049285 TaxID=3157096 RepID=UPI00341B1787
MTATAVLRRLLAVVASAALVLAAWWALVTGLSLDPLIAKTPLDVWHYLGTEPDAAAHRSLLADGLATTLLDAVVGFVAGLLAALVAAVLFVLVRAVERTFLPLALTVRSVPLVAMTPLITLVFGRGLAAAAVVSGVVVFFPALVTLTFGLRSASRQLVDLCRAYGAGPWTVTRRVLLPSALPALFAGARVAVPGAMVGAMLVEWLATGKGLGYAMLQDGSTFEYEHLWAAVVLLTVTSVALYYALAAAEASVLRRFGARA